MSAFYGINIFLILIFLLSFFIIVLNLAAQCRSMYFLIWVKRESDGYVFYLSEEFPISLYVTYIQGHGLFLVSN